jgi:phosphoglycerol transferase MdoB-like AlkP superfamily enzyme
MGIKLNIVKVPGMIMLRGLSVGLVVGCVLALWLSLARVLMLSYYWPSPGADLWAEVPSALLMGLRFDFKVGAVSALLLSVFLGWSERSARITLRTWSSLVALLAVVNFYYYGFYKVPIDSIVFGLLDDDTGAVLQTIWKDFSILQISVVLSLAVISTNVLSWQVGGRVYRAIADLPFALSRLLWVPVLVVMVLLIGKGTLKGMALQPPHLTVTSKAYLNSMVPNGVIALFYAWGSYSGSIDLGGEESGLSAYGFQTKEDAARVLGWSASGSDVLEQKLRAVGINQPNGKNLVFFQMESWSAEPFLYQSEKWDMLVGLKPKLDKAWWFRNFDSAHNGTHQSLEAIMFGTPISPVTPGRYRHIPFDWSLPAVFKSVGYDTIFVTSGKSGWREINRVMKVQGFDEVVDAAVLKARYPEADGGIWGVWDSYMTRYIEERLAAQPANRPLFVYAMSTTNHPPYEIPNNYPKVSFDLSKWPGEDVGANLLANLQSNLQSYRYANDVLASFIDVHDTQNWGARTLVAATGDHNVRSFGVYAQPEREVLRAQVPFVIWGAGPVRCKEALNQPASHLDMFPTLFPLLGIHKGYLQTGRNLADCSVAKQNNEAMSVTFFGKARTEQAIWQVGHANTLACQPVGSQCSWPQAQDEKIRARLALLDWNIRHHIHQATGKKK